MNSVLRVALLALVAFLNVGAAPTVAQGTLTPDGGHLLGNPNAKVKLIAFESYTCHFCAKFEQEGAPPLKLAYVQSGRVLLEVRHFVRDPVDLTAAMLSECVAPSKFYAFHRSLFLNFDKWTALFGTVSKAQRDRWASTNRAAGRRAMASDFGFYAYAEAQGLSRPMADKCLNDDKLAQRLAAQTKAYNDKFDLTGTPSFAINGALLAATHDWASLAPQIEARM